MDQQHQQPPRYSSTNDDRQLIFLPYDKWSPRYESQFYTLRMERYYVIRDPSDWPASTSSGTTTTTTSDDDENEDANSTITCQFCSRRRGGGGVEGAMNEKKKKKYPAVYYEIEILRGSGSGGGGGGAAVDDSSNNNNNSSSTTTSINATSKKVYRRYSQFDTLLRQVDPHKKKYNFPPKTYMLDSWRSTDVLDERMVGLYDFLCNILSQQLEYSNSSNVDGGGGGGVNSSRCIIGNFLEIL